MTLTRRTALTGAAALGATALLGLRPRLADAAAELGPHGLYRHGWIKPAGDLNQARAKAAEAGRHLAVFLEQRGCHACRDMHVINLGRDDMVGYVRDNFDVMQVNLFGERDMVDFDGETLTEYALGNKWRILGTPTVMFFAPEPGDDEGRPGHLAQLSKIQGYLPPYAFYLYFQWIRDGHYKEMGFQTYGRWQYDEFLKRGGTLENWTIGA